MALEDANQSNYCLAAKLPQGNPSSVSGSGRFHFVTSNTRKPLELEPHRRLIVRLAQHVHHFSSALSFLNFREIFRGLANDNLFMLAQLFR